MSRMFSWLLNFAYLSVIAVCAPWILWSAWRTGKYREGYAEKFLGRVPRRQGDATCLWFHAVSVGEVNLLATILRRLRERHPDWEIVVSSTTKTGYQLARKKYADLTVFYCPLDFSWAVQNAMRWIRPTMLVLAELELWPNLIQAARESGAKVVIINGRLSDHSFRGYRRIRPLVAHVLRKIDTIAAQNDETAERFCELGAPPEAVHTTGSLKYDGAETDRGNSKTLQLRAMAGFANDDIVFLAGSTQEPEERIALEVFQQLVKLHPRLRLVLVPRHPERFDNVARMLDDSGVVWQRRSQLDGNRDPTDRRCRVLLVDTIGELGAWWGTADIAFVGGSFGDRGGQNMIEPAAYGAAVSFGPNTWNFRDIVTALRKAEAAVVVQNAVELEQFVARCLDEPGYAQQLGGRAKAFVASQFGATERTIEIIERQLNAEAAVNQIEHQAA